MPAQKRPPSDTLAAPPPTLAAGTNCHRSCYTLDLSKALPLKMCEWMGPGGLLGMRACWGAGGGAWWHAWPASSLTASPLPPSPAAYFKACVADKKVTIQKTQRGE